MVMRGLGQTDIHLRSYHSPITLLASDNLGIEHASDHLGHALVHKLYPRFVEICTLVLFPLLLFCVVGVVSRRCWCKCWSVIG